MADRHAETVPTLEYEGVTFRFPWRHLLRPLTELEKAELRKDMEERGRVFRPILLDAGPAEEVVNVLDGDHRLHFAAELGFPLERLPLFVVDDLNEEEKEEVVVACAVTGRRLSRANITEALELLRAHKQARNRSVLALRESGLSTRQIAEQVHCDQSTVVRILRRAEISSDAGSHFASTESPQSEKPEQTQSAPPDRESADENTPAHSGQTDSSQDTQTNTTNGTPASPARVKGKDGKSYPATKPESEPDPLADAKRAAVLVELEGVSVRKAAEEVGLAEATLRGQLRRDEVRAHVEAERANLPRDDVGQVIPPRLREAFALRAEIDAGCQRQKEQTALCNRLAGRPDFAAAGGRRFSVEAVSASKNAYQWLAGCSPFGVCPVCGGKGCPKKPKDAPPDALDPDHCGGTGWVTYSEWKALRHRPLAAGKLTDCPKCGGKDRNCDPCGGSGLVPRGEGARA